jgi:hypothetical protein
VPEFPRSDDQVSAVRARETAYQAWAVAFEQKRREIERQGVSPSEAGYRLLAELGDFHDHYASVLRHERRA